MHQRRRRLRPIRSALLERAHHERAECGPDSRPAMVERLRRLRDVRGKHALRRASGEWRRAGEQLVRHHAPRIDVRAMIDVGVRCRLLRRHVGRRTQGGAERREPAVPARSRGIQRFGDAQVRDHRAAVREQYVVRLDVAVHDAHRVRVVECRRDLPQHTNGLRCRCFAATSDLRAQRLAFHIRHREVRHAVHLSR